MAKGDPAFLWETAAMRERAQPVAAPARPQPQPEGDWVTLREAHEETGVPISTLRKWARRDRIPSRLDVDSDQRLRLVDLGAVLRLAAERSAAPAPGPSPQATSPAAPAAPEGSMIVPLDAWQKMMTQLGNLHEAGQQLAEARERAAKAETEAAFLRERIADLRAERDRLLDHRDAPEAPAAPAAPGPAPASTETLWDRAVREWRSRRRRPR